MESNIFYNPQPFPFIQGFSIVCTKVRWCLSYSTIDIHLFHNDLWSNFHTKDSGSLLLQQTD